MSFLAIITYTYCKFALDFLACYTPGRKALGLVEKRKEITIMVCLLYALYKITHLIHGHYMYFVS